MRAQGWRFSSDVVEEEPKPLEPAEDVGAALLGAVVQSGSLAAPMVLSALRDDTRLVVQDQSLPHEIECRRTQRVQLRHFSKFSLTLQLEYAIRVFVQQSD